MDKYVLLTEKKWHKELFNYLEENSLNSTWRLIESKNDFTLESLNNYSPDKIFIPHWSYIIPENIYSKYECIVFHMTDLPYGRGGSPLQNLIVRGHTETKISALKVEKGLDTGLIYLKKELDLSGNAQEIFDRSSEIIKRMILEITDKHLSPQEQKGKPTNFTRRTPEMSNMNQLSTLEEIYDYIRMLDADGYPHAFIENENFKFEFTKAKIEGNNTIEAHVRIIKK